jgi:hypothetical protein
MDTEELFFWSDKDVDCTADQAVVLLAGKRGTRRITYSI